MLIRKVSMYVLREFISFLWYSILAFVVIFVLVDLVDNMDGFIDGGYSYGLIFLYYIFFLPYIVVLTLPVSMLLATMFSLGRLSTDNEITAMKASGISFYRILLPLFIFSLFMGFVIMVFAESIVPRANIYMDDIKSQGKEYKFTISRNREMDRSAVHLANDDGRIIYARSYQSKNKIARDVFIIVPISYSSDGSDIVKKRAFV